jgi:hypothetical protein
VQERDVSRRSAELWVRVLMLCRFKEGSPDSLRGALRTEVAVEPQYVQSPTALSCPFRMKAGYCSTAR